MKPGFNAAQRRRLERAASAGEPVPCPACGAPLSARPVRPSRQVSYVRRRLWVVCPGCHRSASVDVDVRPGGEPGSA